MPLPSSKSKIAFCMCMRFSAWSNTMDSGESITPGAARWYSAMYFGLPALAAGTSFLKELAEE